MKGISCKTDCFAAIEIILQEIARAKQVVGTEDSDACRFVLDCLEWTSAKCNRAIALSSALGDKGAREVEKTVLGELLRSVVILERAPTDVRQDGARILRNCIWLRVEEDATLLDPASAVDEKLAEEWSPVGKVQGAIARRVDGGIRLAVLPPPRNRTGWTALLGPLSIGEFDSSDTACLAVEAAHARLVCDRAPSFLAGH